jgi:hypothetical protein
VAQGKLLSLAKTGGPAQALGCGGQCLACLVRDPLAVAYKLKLDPTVVGQPGGEQQDCSEVMQVDFGL